jgi:hypothetical protein
MSADHPGLNETRIVADVRGSPGAQRDAGCRGCPRITLGPTRRGLSRMSADHPGPNETRIVADVRGSPWAQRDADCPGCPRITLGSTGRGLSRMFADHPGLNETRIVADSRGLGNETRMLSGLRTEGRQQRDAAVANVDETRTCADSALRDADRRGRGWCGSPIRTRQCEDRPRCVRSKYSRWVEVSLSWSSPWKRSSVRSSSTSPRSKTFSWLTVFDRPNTIAFRPARRDATEWNATFAGIALDLGMGVEVC